MIRSAILMLSLLAATSAFAQDSGLLRERFLTVTGQTVPKPGRLMQFRYDNLNATERRDDKIGSRLCTGC